MATFTIPNGLGITTLNTGCGCDAATCGGEIPETPAARIVRYTQAIGDGINTQFVVTHEIGSEDVLVQVRDSDGNIVALTGIQIIDIDSVLISFSTPPTVGEYTVVVAL